MRPFSLSKEIKKIFDVVVQVDKIVVVNACAEVTKIIGKSSSIYWSFSELREMSLSFSTFSLSLLPSPQEEEEEEEEEEDVRM